PDALVNFLALLGWSPGDDEEIFARHELVQRFTLDGINRKSAIFDTQKLEWMNGQYLAAMPPSVLVADMRDAYPDSAIEDAWWERLITLLQPRSRTTAELVAQARPFIGLDVEYDGDAVRKHWKAP